VYLQFQCLFATFKKLHFPAEKIFLIDVIYNMNGKNKIS